MSTAGKPPEEFRQEQTLRRISRNLGHMGAESYLTLKARDEKMRARGDNTKQLLKMPEAAKEWVVFFGALAMPVLALLGFLPLALAILVFVALAGCDLGTLEDARAVRALRTLESEYPALKHLGEEAVTVFVAQDTRVEGEERLAAMVAFRSSWEQVRNATARDLKVRQSLQTSHYEQRFLGQAAPAAQALEGGAAPFARHLQASMPEIQDVVRPHENDHRDDEEDRL